MRVVIEPAGREDHGDSVVSVWDLPNGRFKVIMTVGDSRIESDEYKSRAACENAAARFAVSEAMDGRRIVLYRRHVR